MTEMLKKEFSRKSFVKGGGALVVGFSALGAGMAGRARAAADEPVREQRPVRLRSSSIVDLDPRRQHGVGEVRPDRARSGCSNLGLLMIAAEELDMDVSQLTHVRHDTNVTPDTGNTAGSSTISRVGPMIRSAAATARQALLGLAATQLGVSVSSLTVSKGVVSGGGKSVTYGELIGDKLLNVKMAAASLAPGAGASKPVSSYKLVGDARLPQIDIPAR